MDNYAIADQLSLLAKLIDIHGDNSFKAKSYASAAFSIEKYPEPLSELSKDKLFKVKGIGESVGANIIELIEHGELDEIKSYLTKTPSGVLEMMNIKGLGPKKINTIWKELQIDTIADLEKACAENRIAEKKGFGEKTQQNILEAIRYQKKNAGKYLYAQVEAFAEALFNKIETKFSNELLKVTGAFRRQLEIIEELAFVTTISKEELSNYLVNEQIQINSETEDSIVFHAENTLLIRFYLTNKDSFYNKLFETSCSQEFLAGWRDAIPEQNKSESEEEIFKLHKVHYIPAFLREKPSIIKIAQEKAFDNLIQTKDIKGLIHSHSNWSDGAYTI